MLIKTEITSYLTPEYESIKTALNKIQENEEGITICISDEGVVSGVLSDGDIRRWLLSGKEIDLDKQVISIANKSPITLPVNTPIEIIITHIANGINLIPLIDDKGKCISIAIDKAYKKLQIGNKSIGDEYPCYFIAEIGNNHQGSYETAKVLVDEGVISAPVIRRKGVLVHTISALSVCDSDNRKNDCETC